jgi:hypothetical protein
MTVPKFACVLRSGGDYLPEHVEALAYQVKKHSTIEYEFICLTDHPEPISGATCIPLEKNYPGWWSCVELYRLQGPVVAVGVDTMIRGNIDGLFRLIQASSEKEFWMIRAFKNPRNTISGILGWNGDWSRLYKDFKWEEVKRRLRGDEDYVNVQLKKYKVNPGKIQDAFPGVYSFKRHCVNGIPEDCSVLVFHGQPRPFKVPNLWNPLLEEMK